MKSSVNIWRDYSWEDRDSEQNLDNVVESSDCQANV